MQSYHEQLHAQALKDLSNRSKSGIFMYIVVWFVITISFGVHETHTTFFQLNSLIFSVLVVLRIAHLASMHRQGAQYSSAMSQWFNFNILACALHWGIMVAWVIQEPSLEVVKMTFMIITPAFALGGACTLSISNEIRILYPTLMFVPVIGTFALEGGTLPYVLAGLCSFALLYIFASSKASHKDYWEAITNYLVAEERAELMEKLSITDPLTQTNNRMYFDSEYSLEWRRCLRLHSPLSVIMIDIDFFKQINDNYGHIFGDECLKAIAKTLADEVKRPTDCVARYGGEEFIALLPNTDASGTQTIAKRILRAVENMAIEYEGKQVTLTVSIGGATIHPKVGDDRNNLIRRADSALYEAKNSGRNRYCAETMGHG